MTVPLTVKTWFHSPVVGLPGDEIELDAGEARHAGGARRLADDAVVTVFDGNGTVATCRLRSEGRRLFAQIDDVRQVEPLVPGIHVAVAPPKGDRFATMLSMLTQLGVARITPLVTRRGVVKPGAALGRRAERIMIEACKQCRLAHLPVCAPPAAVAEVAGDNSCVWIAHPGGQALASLVPKPASEVTVMIGPEGGFTEDEIEAAVAAGAIAVDLDAPILRIETAAVALASVIRLGFSLPGAAGKIAD